MAQQGDQFEVGAGQVFVTLAELIEHHRQNAMVEKTGTVVTLKQPYNATRFYAASIQKRVEELEVIGAGGKSGFWEEFEVSCLIDFIKFL